MSFSNFGGYISGPCAFLHLPTSTTAATMATEDGHVASSDSEPEGEEFRDRTQSQPDDALVIVEEQEAIFEQARSRQKCPDLC
ncbi:hypothetical protein F441_12059 [Phytophthora nicotianae CJ01A1]|uniref:Uncharacterized protein n=2 Tax=Phytophthora nicotianae TaxID=4792 RepID=W2IRV8_PHYNI|nr:hypothetical protein L915_11808 [Phytophthora nicotianae]ETL36257.1 hypothetical protein L916_11733 [Phytophthora nicotianae]ETP12594.1 hypothetical protein F441_12059 [Phytophthora nicotianae CJ01A1]